MPGTSEHPSLYPASSAPNNISLFLKRLRVAYVAGGLGRPRQVITIADALLAALGPTCTAGWEIFGYESPGAPDAFSCPTLCLSAGIVIYPVKRRAFDGAADDLIRMAEDLKRLSDETKKSGPSSLPRGRIGLH